MDKDTVLIILGVLLLLAGIAGRIESEHFKVGFKSRIARTLVGSLGAVFILFHFLSPRDLITSFVNSKTILEIKPFEVKTEKEVANYLAMKVEKNLVEQFAMEGVRVLSNRTMSSFEKENGNVFTLRGSVYESDGMANIDVMLSDPDGQHVASASITGNSANLRNQYKVLPDALLYGLDVDMTTFRKRRARKLPTKSIEAYAEYRWALRKYREQKVDEAVSALTRAVSLDPNFAMAYWTGSEILKETHRIEATEWNKKAIEIDPDHPRWPYASETDQGNPVPHLLEKLRKADETQVANGLSVKVIHSKPFELQVIVIRIAPDLFAFQVSKQDSMYGNSIENFLQREGAVFAINGGMYSSDHKQRLSPVGLLIVDGALYEKESDKLSGAFVVTKSGRATILPTHQLGPIDEYKYAIQSRPLLVDPGGKFGIYTNDYNRMNRSAVCVTGDDIVFFLVNGQKGTGLSLYELAELLHTSESHGGLECNVALNLDGGPSSQMALDVGGYEKVVPGLWNVQNAILTKEIDVVH